MKANELQIGDWVNWKKGNMLTPCKIDIGDLIYVEENAVAIPLTAEILEKNGWKEMPSGTICYWDKTNKSNDIMCDSGLSFSFLGRTFYPKYVHELQHTLRLCGLDELADNFKV